MSKLLAQKRERVVALQEEIRKLAEQEERSAEDSERGVKMLADLEVLEKDFDEQRRLEAAAEKRAALETPAGDRISGIVAAQEVESQRSHLDRRLRSLGGRFAESDVVKDYRANARGKSAPFEVETFYGSPEERAVIYGGALAADMVRPQLLPGIVRGNEPIGQRAVRDVLLNGQTNSDSVLFVKENVFTNAAATVAEATSSSTGAKPESSLTFTQASAPVEVIAHWIPITRQALDDVPMLQSYVEGRLIDGLRREENDQLLNGDGTSPNISGILDQSGIQNLDQTYFTGAAVQSAGLGPENFNRILRAKTLIMTTGDSMATFIVMNPTDWELLITSADANENYFGPGPFTSAGNEQRIWGLDVVLTEDKAAGSYVVGDGTAAQVWDRMAARLLIADQHSDFFVRNMLVLLAEERLGLAVYRPAAFALVDLV